MVSNLEKEKYSLDKNFNIKTKDIRKIPLKIYNGLDSRKGNLKDNTQLPSFTWNDFLMVIMVNIDENYDSYKDTIEKLKKKRKSDEKQGSPF